MFYNRSYFLSVYCYVEGFLLCKDDKKNFKKRAKKPQSKNVPDSCEALTLETPSLNVTQNTIISTSTRVFLLSSSFFFSICVCRSGSPAPPDSLRLRAGTRSRPRVRRTWNTTVTSQRSDLHHIRKHASVVWLFFYPPISALTCGATRSTCQGAPGVSRKHVPLHLWPLIHSLWSPVGLFASGHFPEASGRAVASSSVSSRMQRWGSCFGKKPECANRHRRSGVYSLQWR